MEKRHFLKVVPAVLALMAAALACNFSVSTAKVENLRLASDKAGVNQVTTFAQEDNFYLLGELKNAPNDTKLKATWIAVDAQNADPNTTIEETELETGSGTFTFSLEKNMPLWPPGSYRVDLYMSDELNQSLDFTVEQTVEAELSGLSLALDAGGSQPTSLFPPEAQVFLTGELANAANGTPVRVVWSATKLLEAQTPAGAVALTQGVISEDEQAFDNGPISFNLKKEGGLWPLGEYSADVYLNGALVDTLPFEVEGAPPAAPTAVEPASEAAVTGVFLARDKNGDQDTNVFNPAEVIFLLGTIQNAPEGAQMEAVWMAENVEGYQPNDVISTPQMFDFAEGDFSISLTSNAGAWTKGQYKVDLMLNGVTVETRRYLVTDIKVINPFMATDDTGETRITVYGTAQPFFVHFTLGNAPADTRITTKWFKVGAQAGDYTSINTSDYTFASGDYYVRLQSNSGVWETGDYVVDLFLQDYFVTSVYFEVQ
ncbi:MAG: hypothetical protein M5U05_12825 [Anaerolineales bacterium]|nr:hypothetical protein [Anaerolineales bacterium]